MMLDDDTFGQCICGNAWFELDIPDEIPITSREVPAVCIDAHGMITGYAGKLVCLECGADWDPNITFRPTGSHLRVVE